MNECLIVFVWKTVGNTRALILMALIVTVWTSIILFAMFYKPPTLSSLKRKRQQERAKQQRAKEGVFSASQSNVPLVTTSQALLDLKEIQKRGTFA